MILKITKPDFDNAEREAYNLLKNNNPVKVTFENPNFDEIGSKTYKIN